MDMIRIFETPGGGGAVAITAITALAICYYLTLKWVSKGQDDNSGKQ